MRNDVLKPEFDRIIAREAEAALRKQSHMDAATFNYRPDDEIPQRIWLSPAFNAIWDEIKTWDVNIPTEYAGYMGCSGTHVWAILQALYNAKVLESPTKGAL